MPNLSPVLDEDRVPMGPEALSVKYWGWLGHSQTQALYRMHFCFCLRSLQNWAAKAGQLAARCMGGGCWYTDHRKYPEEPNLSIDSARCDEISV